MTTTDTTHQPSMKERHRASVLAQVEALRALCDFAEQHADTFPDYVLGRDFGTHVASAEEMVQTATALGGRWEKRTAGSFFYLERDFGGSEYSRVTLSINTLRENVCERVQVGTETRMVPDPDLVQEIPLVEVQEPVFEWRCPDSLLNIRPADFAPATEDPGDLPW